MKYLYAKKHRTTLGGVQAFKLDYIRQTPTLLIGKLEGREYRFKKDTGRETPKNTRWCQSDYYLITYKEYRELHNDAIDRLLSGKINWTPRDRQELIASKLPEQEVTEC